MTQHPESPESGGFPPAGPSPYPYSYPPGPLGPPPGPPPPGVYPGGYPPPPMPYGDYGYPGMPAAAPRNGLGVAALILAIIALLGSCSVVGGVALGIAAVILGFLGRGRVARGEADNGGVAMTGIILGALAVVVSLAFIAMYVGIYNRYGGQELLSCIQAAGNDSDRAQQCMDEFQQRIESQTGQTGG